MLGFIDPPRRAGQPPGRSLFESRAKSPGTAWEECPITPVQRGLRRSEAGLGRTVGLSRRQPARIADRRAAENSTRHSRSTHAWLLTPVALALAGSRSNSVTRTATPGPSLT